MMQPIIHPVFEPRHHLGNFEPAIFTVSSQSADALLKIVRREGYRLVRMLETHAHADHLSAAYYIQAKLWALGQPHAPICIQQDITIVQNTFAHQYNIPHEELENAFDSLLKPDEEFPIGQLTAVAMHLPGHIPDHGGYKIGNNVFTGDTIFNPDVGTSRCDFPGGDPRKLWHSMQRLLSLPPETRLYTGHDYPPSNEAAGRDPMPCVTVAEQKKSNKHLKDGSKEEDYVQWRAQRDHGISEPRLMHQALQVNVRGGKMPGKSYDGKALFQYVVDVPKDLLVG